MKDRLASYVALTAELAGTKRPGLCETFLFFEWGGWRARALAFSVIVVGALFAPKAAPAPQMGAQAPYSLLST